MAKPKKPTKTNALRELDTLGISYECTSYDCDGFMDGVSVAAAIGKSCDETYKTLVTVGNSRSNYVFVIPADKELDLKKAAAAVGEKSVAMIHAKDITPTTGYVKGGCSPVGMKKAFRTVIHAAAADLPTITVSAGKLGMQMTLAPADLAWACKAEFAEIIH
ncbi:MAG: Cys-tRNA(Pro) deacylase [Firmicutes bacterium]|nr:Cys-tRNA(Pro) deacylase [Bacillota bacterium]MBQ3199056.1 Cys-tRNA(Pro) deacylase [Bacillota bacterium]